MSLLTMQEVATEFGVDYHTVSRWMNAEKRSQRLRCLRRGHKYVRFTTAHLADFKERLDSGKIPSTSKKRRAK